MFHLVDLCNTLNRDCNYPLNQVLTSTEAISWIEWKCPGNDQAFRKGQYIMGNCDLFWTR